MLGFAIQSIKIFWKSMGIKFDLNLEVKIKPRWWKTVPEIRYGFDNETFGTVLVNESKTLVCNCKDVPIGNHRFWIEYINKDYNECILDQDLDMAVEIEAVTFEGMTLDRFKWAGEFYPDYPFWLTNQQPVIKSATYLGWNGKWVLPFTTPIFTWIHKTENLGWLYKP